MKWTSGAIAGLICLFALTGCAITDEQRFPLDYASGAEVSYRTETAREALSAYVRMGAGLERQGRFAEAALAYNNAVRSAWALGRLEDALDISQKAIRMGERSGNLVHLGVALARLGTTYLRLGAPDKAILPLEQGALAGRRAREPEVEGPCNSGLSAVYRSLGDREKALEYSQRAVDVLSGKVSIWKSTRFGIQARPHLAKLEMLYAGVLMQQAWNLFALDRWESADATFQKVAEIGERYRIPPTIAQAHLGLGSVATRKHDWPSAIAHLEEAIQIYPQPNFIADAQARLGRVYRGMGKLPEAEASLRQAVAGFEDLRSLLGSEILRESYFENKAETYELLVLTLLDQGKVREAFDFSERARARAFLDLLGSRVPLSRGRSDALVAEEQALRERIAALKAQPEDAPGLQRELDLARDAYQAFLQRVRQVDREQASLMTVEPLTLPQVQALLPEGSLLLEYFVTDAVTVLWTVERTGVRIVQVQVERGSLERQVRAFRNLIASRGKLAEVQQSAQALFDTLVRPGLEGRPPRELLIVPHDTLHYLPFQALMPAADRFLIQDAPLYYYSSASLIQFTRAKAQAAQANGALAVGNPDLGDPRMNLWYAGREAREVQGLYPGATAFIGREATKGNVEGLVGREALVHFATHADLEEQDPLGSALLLHPDGTDDGRLEVQQVFGLTLNASLVVLSACETALGKLGRGDELTGLTRAFIYAGTPSIITTLWQVNDRSAYELMGEFYRNLKTGEDKAAALRQAQIATLAKYPDPYYWAAYELTGEAR